MNGRGSVCVSGEERGSDKRGERERRGWYKHTSNGQCVAVGQEERGDERHPENDVESSGCLWLVPQE